MSIIYEALRKAEDEIKDKPRAQQRAEPHEDFVSAYKKIEQRQKVAIHERLKTSIVPEHSRVKVLNTVVVMTLLFACAGIALYAFYLKDSYVFKGQTTPSVASSGQVASREVVVAPLSQPLVASRPQRDVVVQKVATPKPDMRRRLVDTRNMYFARSSDADPLFVLNGIIIEPNEKYCFLNGVIMRVGQTLNGARVVMIADRKVVLMYKGKEITLLLPASQQ